jgi:type I restriction enzyme S subunit
MNYREVKIKELGKVITGTTPPTKHKEYFEGSYPFIKPSDLQSDSRHVEHTEMTLSQVGKDLISKNLLPTKTTCIVTIGTIGKYCLTNKESFSNQQINAIIPNENFDNDYVFYLLKSNIHIVQAADAGSSSGRENVNKSTFQGIKIWVHGNIQTQKRISDILSAYDDLIENNLKRIKLLEQAAQNIYKEWFVNMRFPGHENAIINEETGLPEGWEKQSAFNLFDIKGGTQPPKPEWSDDLKDGYVRMVQIRDYKTDLHIAYVKNSQNLRRCDRQDVMIARYGASVGRICWGLKGAYNVALVKVVPYDNAYLEYIRWYVKSYYFQESLVSMTQRAAQDGFNKDTFKSLDAIIPTIKVVNDFHNMVYPMLKQMESLKNQNQKLKGARDILLPRLMNRTIEV